MTVKTVKNHTALTHFFHQALKHGVRFRDEKKAFDNAVKVGALSCDLSSKRFAGLFEYRHTTADGFDAFKNINNQEYIFISF